MAIGSAASDDAVENAINHGSLIARQNRPTGILNPSAIGGSTSTMNAKTAPYSVSTSTPRWRSTPKPLRDVVTAIAAPMPIGAYAITMSTNLNITCDRLSQALSMNVLAGPCTRDTATAKMIEKNTI